MFSNVSTNPCANKIHIKQYGLFCQPDSAAFSEFQIITIFLTSKATIFMCRQKQK